MANILVVDDLEDITDLVKTLLENEGHAVDIANNAKNAKKIIKDTAYDILITDVLMPEESGICLIDDICKMANQNNKPTKIIVMSGGGPTMEKGTALGAASFQSDGQLNKPFTKEELVNTVNQMLASNDL